MSEPKVFVNRRDSGYLNINSCRMFLMDAMNAYADDKQEHMEECLEQARLLLESATIKLKEAK